jgi:hypothetical protein
LAKRSDASTLRDVGDRFVEDGPERARQPLPHVPRTPGFRGYVRWLVTRMQMIIRRDADDLRKLWSEAEAPDR